MNPAHRIRNIALFSSGALAAASAPAGGGSSPPPVALTDAVWGEPYFAQVATSAADGMYPAPYGLTATVAGGIMTVSGTPE